MTVWIRLGLALGFALSAGNAATAATLLQYWDFNNVTFTYNSGTGALGSFATSSGQASPAVNNGEIYNTSSKTLSSNAGGFSNGPVFTNGVLNLSDVKGTANSGSTGTLSWGAFSDSGNVASGDASTKQGSLGIFTPTRSLANNPTLTFSLSSVGYSGLTLSFDARKPGNGNQPLLSWSYSLDGTNYFSFSGPTLSAASGFSVYSLSLPTAVDNVSSFQIRGSFDFTPNNTGTSFAIDNLQLNAISAVPEPQTWGLLGTGLLMLLSLRRLRARLE